MAAEKMHKAQAGIDGGQHSSRLNAALYIRLSREDGDKTESLSVTLSLIHI